MNGFKVAAVLDPPIDKGSAAALANLINEGVLRAVKTIIRNLTPGLESGVLVGGNTMAKVGMFRVPLSLHWSTKLSSIPTGCVKDFITLDADPSRVVERVSTFKTWIETLTRRNSSSRLIEAIGRWRSGDLTVLYWVKECVRSGFKMECNA